MKLHNCKKHKKQPMSYLFADHKNMTCKWVVCCTACLGLNEFASKETMFKVVYDSEINEMRKDAKNQWNQNN